ncbi:MAG: voltage-gated potassium channel [Actinomycetota bacterium]|nr:voltage-gated potassium channel [Actinomycetota bacterium]
MAPMTSAPTSVLSARGERWVQLTRKPLDILALVFLGVFVLLWGFPDAPPALIRILNLVTWVVWGAFAIDYVVRLACSSPKGAFVRTHKLDLLMVLVPMLRLLRVALVLRKALASVSTERIASSIVSIVAIVVLSAAFLVWRIEYDAPGATILTFREAIWWAVVTTTTVGYGDYTPVTQAGRLVAAVLMIVGIGLIGTVSATVATWFVNRPKGKGNPDAPAEDEADADIDESVSHDVLLSRLDALSAQQAEIRALLEQMTKRP